MEPLRGEPSRVVSNHVNDHSLRVTLPSHSDAGSRTAPPSQLPWPFPGEGQKVTPQGATSEGPPTMSARRYFSDQSA